MEFLRYPQVIPGFFNRRGCGPPRCLTTASACSWIGHPVSGLIPATSYALFRLALAAAPELQFLNLAANINSPDRSTKSTRSSFNGLSVLVGTRFQVLFHSPPGVLFTFPSRYPNAAGTRTWVRKQKHRCPKSSEPTIISTQTTVLSCLTSWEYK